MDACARLIGHRGPDDDGLYRGDRWIVAHRRLSIIDVAGGRQPLFSDDRSGVLVCNGEIYNHGVLRRELSAVRTFATHCDSEVVVQGFSHWGSEVVHRLDGMYAFVVVGEAVLAARDPLGIKPLYWGRDNQENLWFASEFKSLVGRGVNIEEFPAGHLYSPATGVLAHYRPRWLDAELPTRDPNRNHIRRGLENAVRKRLMSDVPVGVFLSGGLDSSIIAALVKREISDLHSFTVGLEGSNDILAARMVAQHLGTHHHEMIYREADVIPVLEQVIYHLESYDTALVRCAIPTFFVARLAARFVKVVLSGEGADEAFAGYLYFRNTRDPRQLWHECRRLLLGLHNMNLQRVDRMTMAHGLEARVPFLDIDFLDDVMSIAPAHKIHRPDRPEKWLLRDACRDLLPDSIVWRVKQEFAQGAGSERILVEHANRSVADRDMAAAEVLFPVDPPRTKEEFLYRRTFAGLFPDQARPSLVGRWRGAFARHDSFQHISGDRR